MQNKVKHFNDIIAKDQKPLSIFARLLDIESEMGELAKEYLKASEYGTEEFNISDDFKEEFSDVLYATISLANELNINCQECIDIVLQKLQKRIEKNNNMGSGN